MAFEIINVLTYSKTSAGRLFRVVSLAKLVVNLGTVRTGSEWRHLTPDVHIDIDCNDHDRRTGNHATRNQYQKNCTSF